MIPSISAPSILILGGGCFGLTAALELNSRGWRVRLVDRGCLPAPDAASTDINKLVRIDYGMDAQHTAMAETSIARWHDWNSRWGQPLYHETGVLLMSQAILEAPGYEGDSHRFLTARTHDLRRITAAILRTEHPAWNAARYRDGYFNPLGGWVESGRVMAKLAAEARAAGIEIIESASHPRPTFAGGCCVGIESDDGTRWTADCVLVAAGAWTPALLPQLSELMGATAQSVFHFRPSDPRAFTPPQFPCWGADLGRKGWYGFPANRDGLVKVANHGAGRRVDPDAARRVPAGEEERTREFLRETFPVLAEAPLAAARVCLYCDTFDGAFWIDHVPDHPGLIIAAGDSGHAFKFAPVLGQIIADAVERKPNPWGARYQWRERTSARADTARASG